MRCCFWCLSCFVSFCCINLGIPGIQAVPEWRNRKLKTLAPDHKFLKRFAVWVQPWKVRYSPVTAYRCLKRPCKKLMLNGMPAFTMVRLDATRDSNPLPTDQKPCNTLMWSSRSTCSIDGDDKQRMMLYLVARKHFCLFVFVFCGALQFVGYVAPGQITESQIMEYRVRKGLSNRFSSLLYVGQDISLSCRCLKDCDPVEVDLQGADVTCKCCPLTVEFRAIDQEVFNCFRSATRITVAVQM